EGGSTVGTQFIKQEAPYDADLWLPLAAGPQNINVVAKAVDVQGRVGSDTLAVLVVDDLTAPSITLEVDPSGDVVGAGSVVRVAVDVSESVVLEAVTTAATLGTEEL